VGCPFFFFCKLKVFLRFFQGASDLPLTFHVVNLVLGAMTPNAKNLSVGSIQALADDKELPIRREIKLNWMTPPGLFRGVGHLVALTVKVDTIFL